MTLPYNNSMDSVEFIKQFPIEQYARGEVIIPQGQQTERLLAIRDGYIKASFLNQNGDERILWLAGRYDLVPTESLFTLSSEAQYFYTALTDVSVYSIDKQRFIDQSKQDSNFLFEVSFAMSGHYDDLLKRINSIEQTTIRNKVISTLYYLGKRFSASDTVDLYEIGLQVTHNDIAAMVGSSRETISNELGELRKLNYIGYDRNTFVVHVSRLKELLDE